MRFIHSDSRLVTIAGGKLTGFRKMAQRVTDLVQERLIDSGDLRERVECQTDKIRFSGGDFPDPDGVGEWTEELAVRTGVLVEDLAELVGWFGTNTELIVERGLARLVGGAAQNGNGHAEEVEVTG